MKTKAQKIKPFEDVAAIYFSKEDECWIAHSLRTDQIGTGARMVDALADVIKAIGQVCREAAADDSLGYLREAPPEIQKLVPHAKKLPHEIYEVAYKMVHGTWPKDLDADFRPKSDGGKTYTAELEQAC